MILMQIVILKSVSQPRLFFDKLWVLKICQYIILENYIKNEKYYDLLKDDITLLLYILINIIINKLDLYYQIYFNNINYLLLYIYLIYKTELKNIFYLN